MLDLPTSVLDYLYTSTLEERSPAYLLVGKDGRVADWGGKLDAYGLTGLQKGRKIGEQVYFLEGLFPLDDRPHTLSCIKTTSGLSADIHLVPRAEGDWVLFLDATANEAQQSLLQQKVNDLALLRQRHAVRWDHQVRPHQLGQDDFPFQKTGERKQVSIVVVTLRGFTAYSETDPPDVIFKTLNLYLRTMSQPVFREGGVIDKIMGDALIALFGLLPTTGPLPLRAAKAAFDLMEAAKDINRARQVGRQTTFDLGIGIASGRVVVGVIDSNGQSSVGLIGRKLDLAASLARRARPWEILIDEDTFRDMEVLQADFARLSLAPEDVPQPPRVFSRLIG